MSIARRQFFQLVVGTAALPAVSRIAKAQTFPTRPITIVVGFAAGGPTDVAARIVAERMRTSLGQSVVVENITGAAGSIGVGRVARAAPDGHTLSFGQWGTHVVNAAIYALPYDVVRDFEPISLISSYAPLIVAKNAVPANDLKELIAWLKAKPEFASQGTAGSGSSSHVAGVFFRNRTSTRLQFVPYRGAAQAIQDLVAGQIDMMITDPTVSVPHVRAGTIKAYAVTAKNRLLLANDIPTVDEAGLPGFYISYWHGLFAPKGTSTPVIDKLNAAVVDALNDPAVRRRFADVGQEIFLRDQQTPEALAVVQKGDIEKWWPIIKAANIKGE